MSAQTTADLAKAVADLAALVADAKADDATLAAAVAALAASQKTLHDDQAQLATALAEENRLLGLFRALGLDPTTGKPLGSPPITPTVGIVFPPAYDPITHVLTVPYSGVATAIGRSGSDSGGYGPWDDTHTPGYLAAANAAHKAAFAGMNVPGASFDITITFQSSPVKVTWRSPGTPPVPVPTPVPAPAAKVRLGVYEFGFGSISGAFERALGKPGALKVAEIYWNMNDPSFDGDFLGAGGYGAWAAADRTRQVLVGMSPLIDEPGNWASTRVRDQVRAFGAYVVAMAAKYGFDPVQVIWRFGYEPNGDWMPWGRQHDDGKGTGYRSMAQDCRTIARTFVPGLVWDVSVTPWDNGVPSFDFVLPSGTDWVGTVDVYDDWLGGLGQTAINGHVARADIFADECNRRGVLYEGYDEIAVTNVGNGMQGAGDNPAFITATWQQALRRGGPKVRYVYFNANVAETGGQATDFPQSLAALAGLV